MLVGGAHGGLVGLEDVAGARRTITRVGGQRHRAAPPFDGIEQEEAVAVAQAQPDEQPPAIGLLPPERREARERRAAAVAVDAGEEDSARRGPAAPWRRRAESRSRRFARRSGAEVPSTGPPAASASWCAIDRWLRKGVLFSGRAETSIWPARTAWRNWRAALGAGGLPPIVDRDGGFGGPLEPRSLRRVGGSQRGVERDVEVTPLHVAAHRRVIGEPVVRVREVDQVHLLDGLQSRRRRCSRGEAEERAQAKRGERKWSHGSDVAHGSGRRQVDGMPSTNPKSEARNPKETRKPKPERAALVLGDQCSDQSYSRRGSGRGPARVW